MIVTGVAKTVSGLCPVPQYLCHNCTHTFSLYWHAQQVLKLCSYGYMTAWSLVFRPSAFLFIFFYSLLLSFLSVCLIPQISCARRALSSGAVGHDVRPPSAITYKWRGCNSPLSYQSFSACCVEVTTDTEKPRVARLPVSSVLCRQCCRLRGVCSVVRYLAIRVGTRRGMPWSPVWSQDSRIAKLLSPANVVRTTMRSMVSAYIFVCVFFRYCAVPYKMMLCSGYD